MLKKYSLWIVAGLLLTVSVSWWAFSGKNVTGMPARASAAPSEQYVPAAEGAPEADGPTVIIFKAAKHEPATKPTIRIELTSRPAAQPAPVAGANLDPAERGRRKRVLAADLAYLHLRLAAYRIQHSEVPGLTSGGLFDGELFIAQLTKPTDYNGVVRTGADSGKARCGPYLRALPANVFVDGPNAAEVTGGPGPAPFDGSSGWHFNTRTGMLYPNHPGGQSW